MKKIIALAVAGAFVAPVAVADVTISGVMDMSYHVDNNRVSTATTKSIAEDSTVTLKASTELANGLTVSADFNIHQNNVTDDANSIDIAGPFGKLGLGDNAGAIDGIDGVLDYTRTVAAVTNETTELGAGDAGIRWDLPTFVDGVSIALTASGKDGNTGASVDTDVRGGSIKYAAGPLTVAYAREDIGSTNVSGYSASVVFGGIQLGTETYTSTTDSVDTDLVAVGGSYTMGDVMIAYRASKTDSANVDQSDIRTMVLNYSLGSGVTLFAERASEKVVANDAATESETAFGVEYKF